MRLSCCSGRRRSNTRIRKVVTMLQNMQKTVKPEGKKEEDGRKENRRENREKRKKKRKETKEGRIRKKNFVAAVDLGRVACARDVRVLDNGTHDLYDEKVTWVRIPRLT